MKKLIFAIVILGFFIFDLLSQTEDLTIKKQNREYFQSGIPMSYSDLEIILSAVPAAAVQIQKSNHNYNIAFPATLFGTAGLLIGSGINIASAVQKERDFVNGVVKTSYPSGKQFIIIGGGIAAFGVTFFISASHHKNKAIRLYNSSLKKNYDGEIGFNLILTNPGIGVRLDF